MSRYILAPRNGDSEKPDNEIFCLVPTEGLSEQIKNIELPTGLVPRLCNAKKVKSSLMLDKLMMKISKANISRSKDGSVTVGSKVIDTKFDDFVVDCCNGQFSECYEELYCILRKNGITF